MLYPTNNQTTLADQEPQPEQKKEDVNPFTRFFGGLADFVMRDTTDFDKQEIQVIVVEVENFLPNKSLMLLDKQVFQKI